MKKRDPLVMHQIKYGLNDYNHIRKFDAHLNEVRIEPADTIDLYEKNRAFLTKALDDLEPDGKVPVIVMTHHAPILAHVNAPLHADAVDRALNYAYAATDLENLVLDNADKVALYFHGHTHDQRKTAVGNTMVVTHARGYHEKFFKPLLLLDTEV
jgi:3',5'-cyclic AMP phosphodiesterase CpdA